MVLTEQACSFCVARKSSLLPAPPAAAVTGDVLLPGAAPALQAGAGSGPGLGAGRYLRAGPAVLRSPGGHEGAGRNK